VRGAPLPVGKIPTGLLARVLAGLPAAPADVRLGPALGEDACAIDVPAGTLVAAADPITLSGSEIGRLAVTVNANDLAVSGARPRWFLAVVLLPPGTDEEDVHELFGALVHALAAIGAALVGGHTEVTPVVTRPIVVGQMLGLVEGDQLVRTGGARPGDVVVQVGPVPVEGAAVLAREAAGRLAGVDPDVLEAARAALEHPGISVVEPALLAARLGASSLHDPTEGGLAAGLHELAGAAGVELRVDRDAVLWFDPGVAVCRALGAEPWSTLASGSLLAAFPAEAVDGAAAELARCGYRVSVIGRAETGSGVFDLGGRPIADGPEEVARVLGAGVRG